MKGSSESYWKVSKAGGMELVRTDRGNIQRLISSGNHCQPSGLIPLVRCTFKEAGYTGKTEGARTDNPWARSRQLQGYGRVETVALPCPPTGWTSSYQTRGHMKAACTGQTLGCSTGEGGGRCRQQLLSPLTLTCAFLSLIC